MKKKVPYKTLVICSSILGILMSLQLKTLNLENNGMGTSKKGEELSIELKRLKKEEKMLKSEIQSMKESVDKYKHSNGNSALKEELNRYEVLAGYTDVEGEGIEITIKNNKETDQYSGINYNYDLFLSMINKLNSAQVNAISINGERIINDSYFTLKQEKLYLNDIEIKEPYIIKAIGNPDTLASALQIKYGIVWEMEKYYSLNINIEKKDNVKINAYSRKIEDEGNKSE